MSEEETIKNFKRIVASYSSYPNYKIFYDRLKSSGIKGTIKNTMVDMIDFMENLQKEITNDRLREENLKDSLMEIIETLKLENNVIGQETIIQEIVRLQDENEDSIPKDKIKGKIKEYNKEIKIYEDKMLEITQREKHLAIENKDYIKYSCIISNFTDKIKLLKNLIEEK